jgi:hypothetical protein
VKKPGNFRFVAVSEFHEQFGYFGRADLLPTLAPLNHLNGMSARERLVHPVATILQTEITDEM